MKDPYITTDKAIALLNRKTSQRFEEIQNKLRLAKFDELNVIRQVSGLYEELDSDNRKTFLSIARTIYEESKPNGKKIPDKKWILLLLSEPDPTTGYVYVNEIERKRDYLIESILASVDKSISFRKGMSYWARMSAQYADIVTGQAQLKAFKDAGVKRVRWITRDDEAVCTICHKRDQKTYLVSNVPDRPHWGCRCWFEPA